MIFDSTETIYFLLGIESQTSSACKGEKVYEFALNENPWLGRQHKATYCRKFILDVIRRLAVIGFKFYANININDDIDTLFFIHLCPHKMEEDEGEFKRIEKSPHLRLTFMTEFLFHHYAILHCQKFFKGFLGYLVLSSCLGQQ